MDVGIEYILVVDDNPEDNRLIEEAFSTSPFDPTIHSTKMRDEALDLLCQRGDYAEIPRPDSVLLDWNLSQRTSKEVIKAAKTGDPRFRSS